MGTAQAEGQREKPQKLADFYVSATGRDSDSGSAAAPFATIAAARDAVRKRRAAGLTKNILVLIHGGTYKMTGPLAFGTEDSGDENYSITYAAAPGERVTLSGGREIRGWKKGPHKIWTTEIPEVKAGNLYFRQLFVNGVRAIRARTPNADSADPWCKIVSSTAQEDDESKPVTIKLDGYKQPFQIQDYKNPGDVEMAYICNNDMGRKRMGSIDVNDQTFTLGLPNRWNSKDHGFDWYLSFPQPRWKACYLENALEMLDEPGEWYLDRTTGVLSYWPRTGEDLTQAEVVVPAAQKTLLEVIGTRQTPIINLHFQGIHVEHVDWTPPDWGYMGLFCCTIDTGPADRRQHGFMDSAVDFQYARSCSFTDGGIAHVGAMGLCLGRGTAGITIAGNDISDIGAGGIGISEIRQNPVGNRSWNPAPQPGDYTGYRITNNHIHHCGTDYYSAVGITAFMMQNSLISHNLIHDIAYSGIQWAGDCPGQPAFCRNNIVEYNQIYNTMKVTADGAGLYITYAEGGQTIIRNNLIHDTLCNPYRRGASELHQTDIACHGLYLDGEMSGGLYENNVVYNNAGGPLLFNSQTRKNSWQDNLFLKNGALPHEFIEVQKALTGLEPAYQRSLLGMAPDPCEYSILSDPTVDNGWAAYQYHLPAQDRGVVEIVQRTNCTVDVASLKLRGLTPGSRYAMEEYVGSLTPADQTFYDVTLIDPGTKQHYLDALGDLPILAGNTRIPAAAVGLPLVDGMTSSKNLAAPGISVTLGQSPQVIWIAYQNVK